MLVTAIPADVAALLLFLILAVALWKPIASIWLSINKSDKSNHPTVRHTKKDG